MRFVSSRRTSAPTRSAGRHGRPVAAYRSVGIACGLSLLLAPLSIATATAADIYDRGPRSGSAYDDPRYADIYGDTPDRRIEAPRYAEPRRIEPRYAEPSYAPPHPAPRYAERHEAHPESSYRDDYLAPMPGVRRFQDGRHRSAESTECIDRREARERLVAAGWRDFGDLELREDFALISARRSGQTYRLKLDRCTGEILNARAIGGYPDSYAERRGSRRYD